MRLRDVSLGGLVALGIVMQALPVLADKVGVAAAVNPDAFSSLTGAPQSQINIGKSIFYNERINTTGSGLVQVLLVDGSTFTVGPGSDLVIDKFVYDPKKGTGQIAASFSKGVMRFVGGKLSKNDGGVTVDTPAGALAIRGGIAYADFKSPKNFSILFVFGEYLKLGGSKLYQPGYGWFMNNGQFNSRPFDSNDLKTILAALTNGNPNPMPSDPPKPLAKLFNTESMSQLISDANTQQILDQADKQAENQTNPPDCVGDECNPPPPCGGDECNPPPPCEGDECNPPTEDPLPEASDDGTPGGYSGGAYERKGNPSETGLLDDVMFDPDSNSVSFGISNSESALVIFKENGSPQSAAVFRNNEPLPSDVVQFTSSSFTTKAEPICEGCDFLKWGLWEAHLNYEQGTRDSTNLFADGWWVSGALTSVPDLNVLGMRNATAAYDGTAWGSVLNNGASYDASGNLHMEWSFAQRSGDLAIRDFDKSNTGGLSFGGTMTAPGEGTNYEINKFSGTLDGSGMTGTATGSFVNNGNVAAGGVMGNWGVSGGSYQVSGVFGGIGTPKAGN